MKHVDLFRSFLQDTVNLNDTRVTLLEDSIDAIERFVRGSSWKPTIKEFLAQGSWAHKTIIKPVDRGEFDADLLVVVKPVDGWSADKYVNELYNVFAESGTYKDKVKKYRYCVTITYANERKIDVAPCVADRVWAETLEVCNRSTNEFEGSEPRQYTQWLVQRNAYSKNNSFRKVTRILKYLRDVKGSFRCSSVLLTTLLGNTISFVDQYGSSFTDTPTALKTMMGRLDNFLQINTSKPVVSNPFLPGEDFAEGLTDTQYATLRDVINKYRGWIDDAYAETERYESIAKWRLVFEDEFAPDVVEEEARLVSKAARDELREGVSLAAMIAKDAVEDLVSMVQRYGSYVIPRGFNILPHMQRPKWRRAARVDQATVRAELYRSRGFGSMGEVRSLSILKPGNWLFFTAYTSSGSVYSASDFRVYWRISNTDDAAARARQLRGEFNDPHETNGRWEQLRFRGVHLAEAFIVNRWTDELVGQSEAFRVAIE